MKVLLDTTTLLWMLSGRSKVGPLSQSVIDSATSLVVADASLWEIAAGISTGKLVVPTDLAAVVRRLGFARPTVSDRYFETLAELPVHHRDPFDRMLIAHALTDDLAVVSADPIFARYGVRVVDATA